MPRKLVLAVLTASIIVAGLFLSFRISQASDRNNAVPASLKLAKTAVPTDTPTATLPPVNVPPATKAPPTVTPTPRPTNTPNAFGTPGARPTALLAPPDSRGGVSDVGGNEGLIFDSDNPKLFVTDGFPGLSAHSGGQNGFYYVKNHFAEATLQARWYFSVVKAGYYDVYAYVPANGNASKKVTYVVHQSDAQTAAITIDQSTHPDQWVNLGSYYFVPGSAASQYVSLSNQSNEDTATRIVLFDAIGLVFRP